MALVEALNAHDLSAAYGLYHRDARHLGQPRAVAGAKAMREVDREFFDAFPDHHRHIEHAVCEGRFAAAYMTMTGTHERPLPGLPATGRLISFGFCNFIEVHEGLIRSMRQVYDSAAILRQLVGADDAS